MAARTSRRRTPLGLHYQEAPPTAAVDWTATEGSHIHCLSTGPSGHAIRVFDLTPWPRFGIKGRGSCHWLRSMKLEPPEAVNTSRHSSSRDVEILRLGSEDVVVLSRPDAPSSSLADLKSAWEQTAVQPKGYDAWRDEVWAWFHVCGEELSDLMAMTCPVDLHPSRLPIQQIRQTRVAHIDCTIVRSDRTGTYGLDLLFDVASTAYMLRSIETLAAHDR